MSTGPTTTIFRWNKNLRNILIYFFSSGLSRSVPFLLLPLLTRVLSPTDFGILGLTTVFAGLALRFITFNAPGYIFAHYFKYSKEEMNHRLSVVLNLSVYMAIILTLVVSLIYLFKDAGYYLPLWTLLLIITIAYTQDMLNIAQTINQIETRIARYVTYEILTALLIGGLVVLLVIVLGMKWEGRFLAGFGGYGLIGGAALIYLIRSRAITVTYDSATLKDYLRFSLPAVPHTMGLWALNSIARLFLVKYVSLEEAGYFQVAFQLLMVLALFYDALFKVWNPYFYRHAALADEDEQVKIKVVQYSYAVMAFVVVLALCYLAVAQIIIRIFVYEKYARSGEYLFWLILGLGAFGFTRVFAGYLYHTRKTVLLGMIALVSAVINVALAFILFNSNGPIGVAQATSLSFLILTIMTIYFAVRVYPMPWLHPLRKNTHSIERETNGT